MSETALKQQAHIFIDMLSSEQIIVVNELLSFIINKEPPLVYETDITDEEHNIIEASKQDYRNNPDSFIDFN